MNHNRIVIAVLVMGLSSTVTPSHAIEWPSTLAGLDQNDDAQIDFAEFSSFTDRIGLSRTLAAQHFIRMSSGDALITSQEWFLKTQVNESESWKTGYALEPLKTEPTEVGPADIRAYESVPIEPSAQPFVRHDDMPDEEEAG